MEERGEAVLVDLCVSKMIPLTIHHYFKSKLLLKDKQNLKQLKAILVKYLAKYLKAEGVGFRNKRNTLLFVIAPTLYLFASYYFGRYSPIRKDLLTEYLSEGALHG
jgi:hypothetical protein